MEAKDMPKGDKATISPLMQPIGRSKPAHLRLPAELTLKIIKSLDMRDTISLALTCAKFFHVLGAERLLHKKLKAAFSNFLVKDQTFDDNVLFPLDLMRQLCRPNTYIDEYVTNVHFHHLGPHRPDQGVEIEQAFLDQADAILGRRDEVKTWDVVERVYEATGTKEYCMERFQSSLKVASHHRLLMVLLHLMPRLRHLKMTGDYSIYFFTEQIMMYRLHDLQQPGLLFPSLVSVELIDEDKDDNKYDEDDDQYYGNDGFESLAFFANIPTIKYLKGIGVEEHDHDDPGDPQCPSPWQLIVQPRSSNVETLILINLKPFHDLKHCFEAFKGLKTSEYRHEAFFDPIKRAPRRKEGSPWVHDIIDHLIRLAAHSLEHLTFTTLDGCTTTPVPGWWHFYGSLIRMRNLRTAHIHSHFFWPFGPIHRRAFDPNSARVEAEQGDIYAHPRALGVKFPPSIEELTLDGEMNIREVCRLVWTMVNGANGTKHLPRLRSLRFTDVVVGGQEGEVLQMWYCREICGGVGVKLLVTLRTVNVYLFEAMKTTLQDIGILYIGEARAMGEKGLKCQGFTPGSQSTWH